MTDRAKTTLATLADYLEHDVKDDWLDMSHWALAGWEEQKCGTTACAAGWATVLFKGQSYNGHTLILEPSDSGGDNAIAFGSLSAFDAVAAFFDIDINTADWIFSDSYGNDYEEYEDDEETDYERMRVVRRMRKAIETGIRPVMYHHTTKPIVAWEGRQP